MRRTVAVIDVGSNSIRLLVVRELTGSAFEVLDEEGFDARLGQGQVDGLIAPAAFERGVGAMRVMSQLARSHQPDVIATVGTEALRRATNTRDFVEAVRDGAGLEVRILSAEEEAYASFVGVANSTAIVDGGIVDLGGGSLEFMTVANRSLSTSRSVPLGAIYACQRFFQNDPPTQAEVQQLRDAVRDELGEQPPLPVLHGVGGSIRNMARIIRRGRRYPLRRMHGTPLQRGEIESLCDSLVSTDTEGRSKLPGVSTSRAEFLHAAAIVVSETMNAVSADTLIVSGQGLREGIAWQVLREQEPVVDDVRRASVDGLLIANGFDPASPSGSVDIAGRLFAVTATVHGLRPADLDLLVSAARLADLGGRIEYYDRDRHAEYLVHSADLYGFSHREIVILGALVRHADDGTPDLTQNGGLLQRGDWRRTAILAAILGVGRAVGRRSPSPVVKADLGGDPARLNLTIVADWGVDAEMLAVERQRARFESTLGIRLSAEASPLSLEAD
jgi:exopolyphosphatase/guanosine-5'-triphosphate,3'-diphosphate pyrophosphatase